MVPPLTSSREEMDVAVIPVVKPAPRGRWWVRIALVAISIGIVTVFYIATRLNPYETDGSARHWETHRQLGLPPCSFKQLTGLPCPSCGMTTSFSLFVRGDLLHSVQANWVGTLLATGCLLFLPWALASIWLGRFWGTRSVEWWICRLVVAFATLLLARWLMVLAWDYWLRP